MTKDTIFMTIGGLGVTLVVLAILFLPEITPSNSSASVFPTQVATDAEAALQTGELNEEDAHTVVALKRVGVHITLAQLAAAKSDGPNNGAEVIFAEINSSKFEPLNPRDYDHEPHKAFCFSKNFPDRTLHAIVYYNDDYFYRLNNLPLYSWIASGCAETIRAHGVTSSELTFLKRVIKIVPRSADYESELMGLRVEAHLACSAHERKLSANSQRTSDMCDIDSF